MLGHSYGGVISREFAATHPQQVVGMVLIDATSEPEIPVYDRLDAGPWVDGSVTPAPNQTIDIHATVRSSRRLRQWGRCHWWSSRPEYSQTSGCGLHLGSRRRHRPGSRRLSSDSVHVLDAGVGHLIPAQDPAIVIAAVLAGHRCRQVRPPRCRTCQSVFIHVTSARCIARWRPGTTDHLTCRPPGRSLPPRHGPAGRSSSPESSNRARTEVPFVADRSGKCSATAT